MPYHLSSYNSHGRPSSSNPPLNLIDLNGLPFEAQAGTVGWNWPSAMTTPHSNVGSLFDRLPRGGSIYDTLTLSDTLPRGGSIETFSGPLLPLLQANVGTEASDVSPKVVKEPEWLPGDWEFKYETRLNGATKGRIDKYYISPTGTKFRSKTEVLHFLETGSRKKRALNPESGSGSTPAKEKPDAKEKPERSVRKKKTKENGKESTAKDFSNLDFDFKNPPQSATWVPKDECTDEWTPVVENAVVPETDQSQWSNAFARVTELEKSDGVVL